MTKGRMMKRTLPTICTILVFCGALAAAEKPADPKLARLDGLLQKVQSDPAGTTEAEVRELLRLAKELGRPYSASLSIRGYLSHHYKPSPELLLTTADAAFDAGDYTFAVARYKAYLAAAGPSKQAGQAAATLYTLLVDFLAADEDAYQFMRTHGHKFRAEPPARRFDSWFLAHARDVGDYEAAARMLSLALADKMPLPQERAYYWEHLDWLMEGIARSPQAHFAALPHCKKIVALIRDDKRRSLRYALFTANMAFHAGSAGKDDEALARDFELVAAAARDYVNAFPTAGAMEEALRVMAGGLDRFDRTTWDRQIDSKRQFFAATFARLGDEEKRAMLAWADRHTPAVLATPEQWAQLVAKSPKVFADNPAAENVPLPLDGKARGDYARLAGACKGIPSEDAAVLCALAAGDDLPKVIDHLLQNDAWHLSLDRYDEIIHQKLFPAWRRMHETEKDKLPQSTFDEALLHFGTRYLTKSPIAIYSQEIVRDYLSAAWRSASQDRYDKSQVAQHLAALAWAPFEGIRGNKRSDVFNQITDEARRWAEDLRKEARKKPQDAKFDPKLLEQIAPVQDAIRDAKNAPDPAKAPNELCKAMAEAVLAARVRGESARLAAERRAYALVKSYDSGKTPYGRDVLARIVTSRQRQFANLDLQLEMLADQLSRYRPDAPSEPLDRLVKAIYSERNEWSLRDTSSKYKDDSLKVSELFGKAVSRLADKGQFSAKLFDWFRGSRLGRGWNGGKNGQDTMAKVIEKRLFQKSGYRADPSNRSATTSYMRLIRHEFPLLAEKHPVESGFDDLFLEEAEKAGFLDWTYWEFGRDEKGKVVSAAARLLARDLLPVGPDDAEGVYSLRTLNRWMNVALKADEATRKALLAKGEADYGKTRFDAYAMGYGHFGPTPKDAAERKEAFARLARYIDRSAVAPARLSLPALPLPEGLAAKDLSDAELATLIRVFTDAPSPYWSKDLRFDKAIVLIHEGLTDRQRQAELFPLVGHFWKAARDIRDYNVWKRMVQLTDALRKLDRRDLALAYGSVGLTLLTDQLPTDFRNALGNTRTWALAEMGGIIPVAKGHPLRTLYEAQLAYLTGKQQTAWETYLARRTQLARSYREFDPQFCIWIIQKETEFRNFDRAEALAREMITWFDEVTDRFEAEVRSRLQLAYADIALARDDRPRARALYERIVANKDFAGTRSQLDAELRIADVDARDGNFDRATERLEDLARRKNSYLQTEAAYGMAQVKFAQEEYAEAKDHLDDLFALSPEHAEGRILEGRANLKLKKLEQPTDIDLGEKIGRKFLVPGRPVRVTLVDQNLSVVRKATEIELRVWTDSGDEEFFSLAPFGDSKTKFKGQIATELGAVKKGDHTIQVIGKDRVHYAFSDQFAKVQKIQNNTPYTLSVVTDAELYASSGKILNKLEREVKALEKMIRQKMGELDDDKKVPLTTVRSENQIKPGNKVNVRVVDADRGETRGKDTVTVRLVTSSGDGIKAFKLTETDAYSGIFEGAVPTEPAQATAYASDSQEGAEANFAISAKDYPAWVGLPKPSRSRPKTFCVDLNDNVSLGKMKVVAKEPSRKLKSFLLQTSFNAKDFTTVGAWPEKFVPWNGQALLEFARYIEDDSDGTGGGGVTPPKTIRDFKDYLDQGYLREGQKKLAAKIKTLTAKWDWKVDGRGGQIGLDGNKSNKRYYVAHMQAAFYQGRRQIRTFTLHPKERADKKLALTYLLAVDGVGTSKPRSNQPGDNAIEISRALGKGVHRVEVYVFAHQNANPEFEVTCDTNKPPYQIPCPAEMFDIAKHPEIAKGLARDVTLVTASADKTTFDAAFPVGARARVVRLLITDFESDAPAINKIHLSDAAGKQVLPTKLDFMALRKNQVLEIVPGDRVTVTYEDPKPLTRGKEQHEAFLTATYTDATISACFVEYTIADDGERTAKYIGMRRFDPGDKINVFIQDPDCDVSEKLDTVKFTARTSDGKSIELTALETEEHSGVFLGAVFPIKGAPKRKSELTVKEGDDVILTYQDRENTDPGIPWNRTFAVEQVWFEPPEVRLYDVTSLTLEEADKLAGRTSRSSRRSVARPRPGELTVLSEVVTPRRTLLSVWPESPEQKKPTNLVIGGPLVVEVLFPAITKSEESPCTIYVQTTGGRKKYGKPIPAGTFDPNVPGTLKLTQTPSDTGAPDVPPGYREVILRRNPYALTPLDDGRFTFSVPMKLGAVPDKTLINAAEELAEGEEAEEIFLSINGEDEIFIGLTYKDEKGKQQWVTRKATLSGDFFFDTMDRRYQEDVTGCYVGENLYFRVIDPVRDVSDKKELVALELTTKSGKTKKLELIETYSHSGVFKGLVRVVHAAEKGATGVGVMPAVYGDEVVAAYLQPKTKGSAKIPIAVFKGSDGKVVPFTKRFKDPAIAVETQFMIAESYFELAKRHRQLKQDSLARREIAQGRKLLEEAIRDYPNTTARAQAEYLLADLSLEFGNDAVNPNAKKKHYMDAIARYSDIVATYGDSEYAPKAQYRKALAYEKMEMLDEACEEYVKLSYRYPDNALVAETIARLGQYFLNKGRGIRAQIEKETDAVKRERARLKAVDMFKTAGQVFSRLSVRFPNHRLAGKTMLLSAQCFMQAEDYKAAVKSYSRVAKAPEMDKDLVAEAMYWCGHSYMEMNDLVKAYQMFKKLTWDYPATKWAKFARGRLADEKLANIESSE